MAGEGAKLTQDQDVELQVPQRSPGLMAGEGP